MSWDIELPLVLRHIIGDLSDPYTYDNDSLQELILVASSSLIYEVSFDQPYSIDPSKLYINPDPTVVNRDYAFINLSTLKAAMILTRNEIRLGVSKDILVKSNSHLFDNKGFAKNKQMVYDEFNKAYKEAKLNYQIGYRPVGQAIVSPFRLGYYAASSYDGLCDYHSRIFY